MTNVAAATLALNITAAKTLTLLATDNYTLTIPATGTAALLATENVFTAAQKINVNSTTALLVEQDGVKDNVLVVDTTNGRVGINKAPTLGALDITGGVFSTSQNKIDGTSDQIQLIVQGHSTQTANLQEWQNSSGTALAYVTGAGAARFVSLGIGQVPVANVQIALTGTFDGSAEQAGIQSTVTATPTSDSAFDLYALKFSARKGGAYNLNSLYGMSGNARFAGSAGTITNAAGGLFAIVLAGASGETGTITSGITINASAPTRVAGNLATITSLTGVGVGNQGAAYVTNAYGLKIENQSGASTLNYAIYTNAGLNNLGDQLSIVGRADRIQLIVKANATQTTNLAEFQTSAAAIVASISNAGLLTLAGGLQVGTGFGCNSKTPQTAYASGGASTAGAGAYGFDSAVNAAALVTLVNNIRAALVANGTMS